jgi:hypothetical protein
VSSSKLLIWGAVAVGGYVLWQKYQAQQAAAQQQAATVNGVQSLVGLLGII